MKIPHTKVVEIWTDGGCINNPGAGGLGIIMKYQDSTKKFMVMFLLLQIIRWSY